MYDQLCRELDVPFKRVGQYVCFEKAWLKPLIALYCRVRKNRDGIADTELISGEELRHREPNLRFAFAILQSVLRLCLSLWAYHRLCRKLPCRTVPRSR